MIVVYATLIVCTVWVRQHINIKLGKYAGWDKIDWQFCDHLSCFTCICLYTEPFILELCNKMLSADVKFSSTTLSIYILHVIQICIKVCPEKKVDWAKYHNRRSSKSIWVIKLSFSQNDSPMGQSFWEKDSLITDILFELCLTANPFPVQITGISLYSNSTL